MTSINAVSVEFCFLVLLLLHDGRDVSCGIPQTVPLTTLSGTTSVPSVAVSNKDARLYVDMTAVAVGKELSCEA